VATHQPCDDIETLETKILTLVTGKPRRPQLSAVLFPLQGISAGDWIQGTDLISRIDRLAVMQQVFFRRKHGLQLAGEFLALVPICMELKDITGAAHFLLPSNPAASTGHWNPPAAGMRPEIRQQNLKNYLKVCQPGRVW